MEKIEYLNLPNCIRLTNGEVEVIVTTDVGPRIISYSLVGGKNVLGEHLNAKVETVLGEFKPYGGHRLWIAPENMPNSYAPDNVPVEYEFDEAKNSIRLLQPLETITKTQKEITVTLKKQGSGVAINHKITNYGEKEIKFAAWALTIMRGGGVCEIPNEPFAPYSGETLLPVRNLTLWSYTNLSDSRWQLTNDFIRLKVDSEKTEPQKIGVLNRQGWAAYRLKNLTFTKHFDFIENAVYPDMNSNTELYTAGDFVEIESLSPLQKIKPKESIEHVERWELKANG
ncbi:MAG: DUF4380 domain-containing protein [Acidobacteriota bacterium]|jgi:hypothetical protein|nr:hypothetical protein [Acidobacteriota bacterium]MDQ3372570.1 DUF4380 domain-containing protein [Acidobacteriota bacterium]